MTPAELDALIAALTNPSGSGPAWNLCGKARAALVQLRDENARLTQHRYTDAWREATKRAERAEAEVARLQNCESEVVAMQTGLIAALEAERKLAVGMLDIALGERNGCQEELGLLQKDSVSIFEWLNRKGGLGLDVHRRIDTFLATWSKP